MIDYIDFVPELIEPTTWRSAAVYETMKEVKARVRAWQESEPYKVLNVETVIRPIMYQDRNNSVDITNASIAPEIPHQANVGAWLQVIRVWFDDGR